MKRELLIGIFKQSMYMNCRIETEEGVHDLSSDSLISSFVIPRSSQVKGYITSEGTFLVTELVTTTV